MSKAPDRSELRRTAIAVCRSRRARMRRAYPVQSIDEATVFCGQMAMVALCSFGSLALCLSILLESMHAVPVDQQEAADAAMVGRWSQQSGVGLQFNPYVGTEYADDWRRGWDGAFIEEHGQ